MSGRLVVSPGQREEERRRMFDRAASDVTEEDRREREMIISAFDQETPDMSKG